MGASIRAIRLSIAGLAIVLGATAVEAESFSESFQGSVGPTLARTFAKSIAHALPIVSASAGFVYRFDVDTGTFEREPSIVGQLYLEGADPVGRRRLDLSLTYERVRIDTLQGKDIRKLSDTRVPLFPGFTFPRLRIDLDTNQATAGATYGVTDDLEVNATVLILYSDFDLSGALKGGPAFGGRVEPIRSRDSSKTGVGDLLLRGKYRLLERDWLHLATGLVLRVPTGNEDNFQGTGAVELAPMVYASRRPFVVGSRLRFQPYLNAGFDFDADDMNASEARWGAGLDGAVGERLAVAVAVLGRHPVSRLGRPGLFDVRRGKEGRFVAPLFGLSSAREDFYDFSVGGRVNVWRDRVNVFASVLVPLNRDGARADLIPLAGAEAIF